jgi:hypothetical protein
VKASTANNPSPGYSRYFEVIKLEAGFTQTMQEMLYETELVLEWAISTSSSSSLMFLLLAVHLWPLRWLILRSQHLRQRPVKFPILRSLLSTAYRSLSGPWNVHDCWFGRGVQLLGQGQQAAAQGDEPVKSTHPMQRLQLRRDDLRVRLQL